MYLIEFIKDYPFTPAAERKYASAVTLVYRAGNTVEVCEECALGALETGAGILVEGPKLEPGVTVNLDEFAPVVIEPDPDEEPAPKKRARKE